MQIKPGNYILPLLLSIACASPAFAAEGAPAQTGGATNAIAFAIQAGQIAGAAQACGINIATFTTRVSEAINKLALNPTDQSAATDSFQHALQQAQFVQSNNHPIACSQVNQDFNNLPLLRPDYEQTVIAQLNPGMTNANNAPAANNPAATPAAPNPSAPGTPPAAMAPSANPTTAAAPAQQNLNNQPALNNQTMPNANTQNNTMNTNTANPPSRPANPAYPQQNYGPMKSFSNTYPGAVQPYGMNNLPNQSNTSAAPAPANTYPNTNNPPPPSFSNPNNAPPTSSGNYVNQ